MAQKYCACGNLKVNSKLFDFVENELTPQTGISSQKFWESFSQIVQRLGPINKQLLAKRDSLQKELDRWYAARKGKPLDQLEHKKFLLSVGYLVPEGGDFEITTENVDREIASVAGPQLVCPIDNARYAINAANARWGSLYDALYGSNVISEEDGASKGKGYNPLRGAKVIAFADAFLDEVVPLEQDSWSNATAFATKDVNGRLILSVSLSSGASTGLTDAAKFVGFTGNQKQLKSFLLQNNGLHIEVQLDRNSQIGKTHKAGVKDVVLEAAQTTIQDFEDSVSIVDAEDKVKAYRNFLGLMKGSLTATFDVNGKSVSRTMNRDRVFTSVSGGDLVLRGRSLLLNRNVGHHMYTDAVLTKEGQQVPEGFLDCAITVCAAIHDLKGLSPVRNSVTRSVYIVKPKQHGPEEVALTQDLFEAVEVAFGLPRCTIKIGVMDEERRTTVNLKECIRVAKERIVFINTGFMDRTGDEIHSAMFLGPMLPKHDIKARKAIQAYEDWNVDIGLKCGFSGKAQIGKGMWAAPDSMKEMVAQKLAHPAAGANCAWVPSANAGILHAIHYHKIYVFKRQLQLASRPCANLDDILTPPILDRTLTQAEIVAELNNSAQGILGYVVRWVDQGVGCSKVPDINNVGLMEDRATLRISSQHVANWLLHNIVSQQQVMEALKRMCLIVDKQNAGDRNYVPMGSNPDKNISFKAACDLVFKGKESANGYTEDILTFYRREAKSRVSRL